MATMTACVTNHLHVRTDNASIKKRKGFQYATRSRDSLCTRRRVNENKCEERKAYDYIDLQPEITVETRANLINWVIGIHDEYNLNNETLYLTINIIDRFLATEVVCNSELRVVGLTAMFIASKYIEVRECEEAYKFVKDVLSGRNPDYERKLIVDMEKRILIRLDGRLSSPTLYTFITGVIKDVENPLESKIENMVYFYAELGMINYEIISRFDPLMIAAAAIYGACATLDMIDLYEKLEKQNGFKEMPALECARMMGRSHSRCNDDQTMRAIYEKYTSETRDEVAIHYTASVLLRPAFTLCRKSEGLL